MRVDIKTHLAEDPKASVLIAHGLAEHQGRYTELIDSLVASHFDVYTYDQYGHGKSPGPRARVDVGKLIKDHVEVRQQVVQMMRTEKLFLFGHSMGGLVTAASALINPRNVAGVALSGPALETAGDVDDKMIETVAKAARMFPGAPATVLNPEMLSTDPEVIESYMNDPLVHHGPVPALTASTMVIQGREVQKRGANWKLPLIIFHGSDDQICDPRASWHLVQDAMRNGADAEMIEVPGARHEVFNEPLAPALRETLSMWIMSQLVKQLDVEK